MLHAGLDLSRKRLDFCLLDEQGARVEVGAAPPDVDGAGAEAFWRKALRGFTRPTPLMSRTPGNKPGQGDEISQQPLILSAATTNALHALGRDEQRLADARQGRARADTQLIGVERHVAPAQEPHARRAERLFDAAFAGAVAIRVGQEQHADTEQVGWLEATEPEPVGFAGQELAGELGEDA